MGFFKSPWWIVSVFNVPQILIRYFHFNNQDSSHFQSHSMINKYRSSQAVNCCNSWYLGVLNFFFTLLLKTIPGVSVVKFFFKSHNLKSLSVNFKKTNPLDNINQRIKYLLFKQSSIYLMFNICLLKFCYINWYYV